MFDQEVTIEVGVWRTDGARRALPVTALSESETDSLPDSERRFEWLSIPDSVITRSAPDLAWRDRARVSVTVESNTSIGVALLRAASQFGIFPAQDGNIDVALDANMFGTPFVGPTGPTAALAKLMPDGSVTWEFDEKDLTFSEIIALRDHALLDAQTDRLLLVSDPSPEGMGNGFEAWQAFLETLAYLALFDGSAGGAGRLLSLMRSSFKAILRGVHQWRRRRGHPSDVQSIVLSRPRSKEECAQLLNISTDDAAVIMTFLGLQEDPVDHLWRTVQREFQIDAAIEVALALENQWGFSEELMSVAEDAYQAAILAPDRISALEEIHKIIRDFESHDF